MIQVSLSSILSYAPNALGIVCNASGKFFTGGDSLSDTCNRIVRLVKEHPYSAPISIGSILLIGSYFGSRSFFTQSPAIRSLEKAKSEIDSLLTRAENLLTKNDTHIETFARIKGLRDEVQASGEGSSERKDNVRAKLEKAESEYRSICKDLGSEIHHSLASIQLKENLKGETPGVTTLRTIEANGLKEHVRLGPEGNLMPSDYIKVKVSLVEATLKKLDEAFQEELNNIYRRPKEDNPSHADLFPERRIYQTLHSNLYQGLFEVTKALNTLKQKEPTVLNKMSSNTTRTLACTIAGASGTYLVASSYHISKLGT